MRILKYPLSTYGPTTVSTSYDHTILSVGKDPHGELSVWMEADPNDSLYKAQFYTAYTGDAVPHNDTRFDYHFIGTVLYDQLVLHIYRATLKAELERRSWV